MNSLMKRCVGWGLGGSWAQGLLSLWSWGAPPSTGMCPPTWKPSESPTLGNLWRLPHVGVIDYWLHFQPVFPVWGWHGGAEYSTHTHTYTRSGDVTSLLRVVEGSWLLRTLSRLYTVFSPTLDSLFWKCLIPLISEPFFLSWELFSTSVFLSQLKLST